MKLDFRILALCTAFLFFSLAAILLFSPDAMLASWGVGFSTEVGLVARRGAALSAGIAVMFFMARNAEHSTARTALIRGIITSCLILVFLGVYEFSAGHANSSILSAVLIEVVLVLAFLYVGCSCNKENRLNKKKWSQ